MGWDDSCDSRLDGDGGRDNTWGSQNCSRSSSGQSLANGAGGHSCVDDVGNVDSSLNGSSRGAVSELRNVGSDGPVGGRRSNKTSGETAGGCVGAHLNTGGSIQSSSVGSDDSRGSVLASSNDSAVTGGVGRGDNTHVQAVVPLGSASSLVGSATDEASVLNSRASVSADGVVSLAVGIGHGGVRLASSHSTGTVERCSAESVVAVVVLGVALSSVSSTAGQASAVNDRALILALGVLGLANVRSDGVIVGAGGVLRDTVGLVGDDGESVEAGVVLAHACRLISITSNQAGTVDGSAFILAVSVLLVALVLKLAGVECAGLVCSGTVSDSDLVSERINAAIVLTNALRLVTRHVKAGVVDHGALILAVSVLLVALSISATVVAAGLVLGNTVWVGYSGAEVVEAAGVLRNASRSVTRHVEAGVVDHGALVLAVSVLLVALSISAVVDAASLVL